MHASLPFDSVHLVLPTHVRLTQHFDRVPVGRGRGAVVSTGMSVLRSTLIAYLWDAGAVVSVCMHATLVQASA